MVNEGRDPLIRWKGLLDRAASIYADTEPTSAPAVSPINSRFQGLRAPILLTTGSLDLFAPDCERLVEVLRRDGVTVTPDSAPGCGMSTSPNPSCPKLWRRSTAPRRSSPRRSETLSSAERRRAALSDVEQR